MAEHSSRLSPRGARQILLSWLLCKSTKQADRYYGIQTCRQVPLSLACVGEDLAF